MKTNWTKCFAETLKWEGGYVNHKKDPGGPTNKGVTQKVYDEYRQVLSQEPRSVIEITAAEVRGVYEHNYWKRVSGGMLPSGVDFAVYDYAVNSGVSRAVKDLQRGLGVAVDGIVGGQTLSSLKTVEATAVINDLCDRRMRFLRSLRTWKTFGRGWTRRVTGVRAFAMALTGSVPEAVEPAPTVVPAPAKAPEASTAQVKTADGMGITAGSLGTAGNVCMSYAEQVKPHFGETPTGRAMIALFILMMIVGVTLVALSYIRRIKEAGGLGGFIGTVARS